tara:strand:- start:195 stop:833 length:639 start_codon:yes stop_codon:yes gene_type:complete
MATVLPTLSSGVAPQHAIISRAVIDPVRVLDEGADTSDASVNCPPGVPLFTTTGGIGRIGTTTSRGRVTGNEDAIPVIFNLPVAYVAGQPTQDLIFVGISYGPASRKQPIVAVATGGLIGIPHENTANFRALIGHTTKWKRSSNPYGSPGGPYIGVPDITDEENITNNITMNGDRNMCDYVVQRATPGDCTVLLGCGGSAGEAEVAGEAGDA